ncbi:hypothetical protein PTTG_04228 [Puccinia triticina 1-1 BBBD Race 1]|uniref:Uncharacterized protein n=1 Tax=Puccinia triticina (isolate 1-1 / race 1 (BBBD)) TaxID=630390 RepID=A0A180GA73_PUCT1|nr:hypothetical protein PTTG_04228 [Puccinia triticina 1-1 BBBD Race 1]
MAPPYSTLPNTRPRISSPLTCELTFARQPDHLLIGHPNNAQQQPQPGQPTRTLLLCSAIDALLFIHLARALTPSLLPHAHALCASSPLSPLCTDLLAAPLPAELIIPTLAFLKALSGFCLLHTGSTICSYASSSLLLYTALAAAVHLSSHSPSLPASLAILIAALLLAAVVVCLPLLRLTQVLLDLEDQQALQASRASNITKPSSTHQPRKPTSSFRQSNKARYQHLMNPF